MEGCGVGSFRKKFNLSFLLEHLCSLAHMLFQRQASRSIDVEIVAAEEALARAHKVMQDLKVKKQRVLSFLVVPAISLDSSLLTGLIPYPFLSLFFLASSYVYFQTIWAV